jgi:hypothetical protein
MEIKNIFHYFCTKFTCLLIVFDIALYLAILLPNSYRNHVLSFSMKSSTVFI